MNSMSMSSAPASYAIARPSPVYSHEFDVTRHARPPPPVARITAGALKINGILSEFFDKRGIILVDFKLEFGEHKGEVLLGDEITPDGCRLWDKTTREKMDKDRFRRDLGKVEEAYQEVLRKVTEKI